ncbi:uncharacterized protein LOC125501959 [Athalia rosae]|uniref:uncharacterized protein LOC125501959 n=1 Tax=Athalia rosae TaxID=37344 RepID=UPI0020339E59|nr:uncharacterized protein LOC125501959 [Athalia rosae]
MHPNSLPLICIGVLLLVLTLLGESDSKPWAQNLNPLNEATFLDSVKMSCTSQTENLCQRCAKQTKSVVVYPWCCTDHEGAREWCENYLHYGLP